MGAGVGAGRAEVPRAGRGFKVDALWNPFKQRKKKCSWFLNRHINCLVQRAERIVSL